MDIRNFFGGKSSQGSSDAAAKPAAKKEVSWCLAHERRSGSLICALVSFESLEMMI